MDGYELLMTAVRGVGVYVLMLVVIRLLGKREVGSFSAFDLLVALMLGEVVDEIIFANVSFVQGAVAILVVALLHYVSGWMTYSSRTLDRLLEGTPTIVVRDGELVPEGMRKERMSEDEVMSQLRQSEIDDLREVKLAIVEPSGQISILRQEWAELVQKADLGGDAARAKEAQTGGMPEPPPEKSSISAPALQEAA